MLDYLLRPLLRLLEPKLLLLEDPKLLLLLLLDDPKLLLLEEPKLLEEEGVLLNPLEDEPELLNLLPSPDVKLRCDLVGVDIVCLGADV